FVLIASIQRTSLFLSVCYRRNAHGTPVREKHACTQCDAIVQAPAPSRSIERGIAGPGLLARVLTSKYAEHTPL
ncbi:hypothetical protein NQ217_26220, partial [Escherichia coli]|nr:hypothetical protein [Escherichia coli]